jgi:hypothetical protein
VLSKFPRNLPKVVELEKHIFFKKIQKLFIERLTKFAKSKIIGKNILFHPMCFPFFLLRSNENVLI